MSEINGPKISVNQVKFNGIQKQAQETEQEPQKEETSQLKEFSNAQATIGRSMLFKGSDNTNNDLKVLMENPQIAENSDKMFETMYGAAQAAGVENRYEEAASASTTSF